METRKKFFGVVKNVACLALAFVMAVAFVNPMTVQAKTKKVNLTVAENLWRADEIESVATPVTKGKYKVNVKMSSNRLDCRGYMKFVAPESKDYSFKVSNIKGGKKGALGNVTLLTPTEGRGTERINVKTKGGVTDSIWFAYRYIKAKSVKKVNACLPTRTGKTHLEQGQVVYIEVDILPFAKKTKKASCTISIK